MNSLQQDVIIPIKICKKKSDSHTYVMHQKDYYVVTPLSKLLAKAYIMDKRLKQNPELTFREFCKLNNITPRYLSSILQLNNLSPKLKSMIMDGYQPRHLSIRNIISKNVPVLWNEQKRAIGGGATRQKQRSLTSSLILKYSKTHELSTEVHDYIAIRLHSLFYRQWTCFPGRRTTTIIGIFIC